MRSFAALLVVSACTVASWTEPEPIDTSRVKIFGLPPGGPNQIDLLIVVDDSAAMAAYRPRLAALAAAIDRAMDPRIDLRVAVTSNDGALRGSTPFLAQQLDFNLARTANFRGSLAEALLPRLDVGSGNGGANQSLLAIRNVLEGGAGEFVRDHARLSVLIITAGDDTSPETIDEFSHWLRDYTQRGRPMVGILRGSPTPKLDAVASPNAFASLDAADFSPVLAVMAAVTTILLGTCWEIDDLDPHAPGDQFDCTMSAHIDERERLLRPCRGETDPDPLCWRLVPSDDGCRNPRAVRPEIAAYRLFSFNPALHMECVGIHPADVNGYEPFDRDIVNVAPARAANDSPLDSLKR